MTRLQIVTDSTSDIPTDICKKFNIVIVPLKIQFGSETYTDKVTIDAETFYSKLKESDAIPTTSQPSPQEFMDVYSKILEEQDTEILSIHISSAMSGTLQSAKLAASMLEKDSSIHFFDSLSISYGLGSLVIAAAELAAKGKTIQEIIAELHNIRKQSHIYFLLDTLEYLQRGGRIGKASALIGTLLNVKPILSVGQDGIVFSKDKARGQKKAMERLVEIIEEEIPSKKIHLQIAYSDNKEYAIQLYEMIASRIQINNMFYVTLCPVIGTHTGPGAVAALVRNFE